VMALSQQFKLHAGLRQVEVQRDVLGVQNVDTSFTLPSVSLTWSPSADWMFYATAAHGMEHGGTAPMETANENQVMGPSRSKQLELGAKGVVGNSMTVTGALFEIKRALEYTNSSNVYVQAGEQNHRGIELGAQGNASPNLAYSVSLMALNMRQLGTGQASIDDKRTTNVAAFKQTTMLEYALPSVSGLKMTGTWHYSGKKAFDAANTTFVPGYHLFDLGAAYATRIGGARTTLRATVNNVTDKFYWRDVTPLLGGYLFAGAPRTLRISAQFDY
jgi:iron complex outermembrane receptor protein